MEPSITTHPSPYRHVYQSRIAFVLRFGVSEHRNVQRSCGPTSVVILGFAGLDLEAKHIGFTTTSFTIGCTLVAAFSSRAIRRTCLVVSRGLRQRQKASRSSDGLDVEEQMLVESLIVMLGASASACNSLHTIYYLLDAN